MPPVVLVRGRGLCRPETEKSLAGTGPTLLVCMVFQSAASPAGSPAAGTPRLSRPRALQQGRAQLPGRSKRRIKCVVLCWFADGLADGQTRTDVAPQRLLGAELPGEHLVLNSGEFSYV